ncbi:MAG TPA: neutral zinc metallopeptidase, partial [Noviherbaspirillum sp.]|nr:neutral zinc metallopeptidase [Noviherbaspirillum sp.]
MKWEGNRESDNVEDRRGAGGFGLGGRSVGLGTIAIALVASWFLGVSPTTILNLLTGGPADISAIQQPARQPPADDQMARFVSTVLADTEDTWTALFRSQGSDYVK